MKDWIAKLLDYRDLAGMGHLQRVEDANLGLGWIYYGLARVIRPKQVVVIGSYRGFVPLVLGKALADNLDGGRVIFIDPSFVDDFWKDPQSVRAHFAHFRCDQYRTLSHDHTAVHPIGGLSFPRSSRDGVRGWVSLRGAGSFRL